MKLILRFFLVFILILFSFILFHNKANAAWPLNTPDIQSNPMWAGDNLVWQDNRLGNEDLFIRYNNLTISPLIALPNDQILLSADENYVYFSDSLSDIIYSFNLQSSILKTYSGTIPNSKGYHILYDNTYDFAEAVNDDIFVKNFEPPIISLNQELSLINNSTISGLSNAISVTIYATQDSTIFSQTALVISGAWTITDLISQNALDGKYLVTGIATSLLGITSQTVSLGSITIDHAPPTLTSEIETTADLEEVKIHWHTNEKSTAKILLTASDEIIEDEYSRLTYSHTLTTNNLTPGKVYQLCLRITDVIGNNNTVCQHFRTLNIEDFAVADITSATSGKKQVWQGTILAELGIINDKSILVMLDRPIILEWSTGSPPPNLKRGQLIKFLASLNHDKGALLIHGSKTLIIIDIPLTNFSTTEIYPPTLGLWFNVTGKITHLTKTYWVINNGHNDIKINWHHQPQGIWKKGQTVSVTAIYYSNKEWANVISGNSAVLISDLIVKQAKTKTALAKVNKPKSIIESPVKELTTTTSTSTDKINLLWYSSILIGTSIVISFIFFFKQHKN
jgi:hypothetical protein